MERIKTRHFQYAGTDDYDKSLDEQINSFIDKENIDADQIVDIKYAGHSSEGINTYSALLIYVA